MKDRSVATAGPTRLGLLNRDADTETPDPRGRQWKYLCAFLHARFGAGPPEPEDIVQQAFVRVASLPPHAVPIHPRAYLFRVAVNLMHDEVRKLARRRTLTARSATLLDGEIDEAPDVERTVIAREQMALVQRVIEGMPARHRAYLLASQIEGLSFVAIAEREHVSPSLVRKTIDEAVMVCQRALTTGKIDYRGLSRERQARS